MPRLWTPRAWLRALWDHLVRSHTSPGRLALAVGVGVLIGHLPIIPFHFVATVLVCWVLRLNTATTYLAANVSNPVFLPFLVFGSVQIGHLLTRGAFLPLGVRELQQLGAARFLGALVLGSVVQGSTLGALLGSLVYVLLRRRARLADSDSKERDTNGSDPDLEHAIDETAKRYAQGRKSAYHYVRAKLRTDPVARAVATRGDLGKGILDLGCGRGQMVVLLALLDPERRLRGVDWDASKIQDGKGAARDLAVAFETGDLREVDIDAASVDTVLLLDVLHYLSVAQQDVLLRRACSAVRPGGLVLVRDVDDARGWRSFVTRLEERVFTTLRFNRGARLVFREASDLEAVCRAEGMTTSVEPMWGSTPFANVLLVARKESPAPAS